MAKILVVDDETSIRSFCYDLLSQDGHTVLTVSRIADALRLIPSEKPDLVLLDLNMPGEDSLSFLRKLHATNQTLSVVIFSGFVTPEVETQSFEAGAVEVIVKGLGVADFKDKIKKILTAKNKLLSKNSQSPVREEKILIVDDEDAIRKFLADFFSRKGFQVLEASRGEEALKLVQTEKPSIILLDVHMPGMDGILTLKKIREIDKNVGVVMATSEQNEETVQEATRLGSYHYVLKPFDLKYLELVVLTRLLIAS